MLDRELEESVLHHIMIVWGGKMVMDLDVWEFARKKGLEKILEYQIECPMCGRKMTVEEYIYDMPNVGKVLLSGGKCEVCGYKHNDVRLAEPKTPRKIVFRVEKPGDENTLVIRASSASIVIPELGIEIKPGPAAKGYITTIEGIIIDVLEKTEFLCSSEGAPKSECEKKINELKAARDGAIPYTLIIVDPEGVSAIVSPRAKIEKLE